MPPALPHDFSSFILPPKEKNRCVGISKAPADCVCGVYCSHAVEDLHKIMFLLLAQDLAFPPVHYFCLCVLCVDVTTITKACFFKQGIINAHHSNTYITCNHKLWCECPHSQCKILSLFLVPRTFPCIQKTRSRFLTIDLQLIPGVQTWNLTLSWKLHVQQWCASVHLISQHRFRSWALTDAPIVPP